MLKTKKLIAVLASMIMIVMLCVPVMAADHNHSIEPQATCSHTTVKKTTGTVYALYTSSQHYKTTYYDNVCTKCGVTVSSGNSKVAESHAIAYNNGTHNSSNSTHTWKGTCYSCGYTKTVTRPCSGPPCYAPE